MVPSTPSSLSHPFSGSISIAALPEVPVFVWGLIMAVLVVFLLVQIRQNPQKIQTWIHKVAKALGLKGHRMEARLERVVCSTCGRGKGVYDPVYLKFDGEQFIEGICSHCGSFVRARLR